jgi:sugar/nucleoside kinase (ribokinase family)
MILVVGSVALDSIETPFETAEDVLGGSATFICGASSKLSETAVIGIVGDDFPSQYQSLFETWGVDTTGLEVAEGDTFRWSGRYHADMIHRDTLSTQLGVFEHFQPKVPDNLRDAKFLALGNIHPQQQLSVLAQAEHPQWVIADTMKLWIDIARDSLDELISKVDALVVNDEEARDLTGEISLHAAASKILGMGPSTVIIKRGEHGASLHTGDNLFYCPAFPLHKVFDTTGAGDTFLGGLVGWVARCGNADYETIKQGILVGTCLASFTVESFGAKRLSGATEEDVDERLAVLYDLTAVERISLRNVSEGA